VIWLIEIYQNKLGHLRESGGTSVEGQAEFKNLEEEFLALLRQQRVEECIRNSKEVVYRLLHLQTIFKREWRRTLRHLWEIL
jgi:hypothetical protein